MGFSYSFDEDLRVKRIGACGQFFPIWKGLERIRAIWNDLRAFVSRNQVISFQFPDFWKESEHPFRGLPRKGRQAYPTKRKESSPRF